MSRRVILQVSIIIVFVLTMVNYSAHIMYYTNRLSSKLFSANGAYSYNNLRSDIGNGGIERRRSTIKNDSESSAASLWPLSSSSLRDLDKLPYCTSLSPTLARALIYYRDNIHKQHGSKKNNEKDNHHHNNNGWLYFQTVEHGANGGLADRLKGLINVFMLALISNRTFGIDWLYPVPIKHFYEPSLLPWLSSYESLPVHVAKQTLLDQFLSSSSSNTLHVNWIGREHNADMIMNDDHPLIIIRANLNQFDSLWSSSVIHDRLLSMGFTPSLHLDSYYSCILQFLLRPSYDMQTLVNHQLNRLHNHHQRGIGDGSGSSRSSKDARASYMICAQIRLGSGGGTQHGWRDSRSFGTLDTARHVIFNGIKQHINTWCKQQAYNCSYDHSNNQTNNNSKTTTFPPYYVFITTDSQQLSSELDQHFGEHLIYTSGDIVHVDRMAAANGDKRAIDASIKVAADNWLLGYCNFAIISLSGYGSLGVWRTRIPHSNVKVFTLGNGHQPPSIVDYVHHLNGNT
jgi:hypothetical protein